jgi:hypothetical protein
MCGADQDRRDGACLVGDTESDPCAAWLREVVRFAVIIDDGSLEDAWEGIRPPMRRLRGPDDLIEHVLGQADTFRWDMRKALADHPELIEGVELFLHGVRRLRLAQARFAHVRAGRKAPDAGQVSQEWLDLRGSAHALALAARHIAPR